MNRDSGALELCVLVLYRTELYNKLIYALNDAGIRGATTVSSSGMMSALADSEDSHIIAAFRAFMASGVSRFVGIPISAHIVLRK